MRYHLTGMKRQNLALVFCLRLWHNDWSYRILVYRCTQEDNHVDRPCLFYHKLVQTHVMFCNSFQHYQRIWRQAMTFKRKRFLLFSLRSKRFFSGEGSKDWVSCGANSGFAPPYLLHSYPKTRFFPFPAKGTHSYTSYSDLCLKITKTECDKTKNCYSEPKDCKTSDDCDYLLTYQVANNKLTVEMSATTGWVAVGFNSKQRMVSIVSFFTTVAILGTFEKKNRST